MNCLCGFYELRVYVEFEILLAFSLCGRMNIRCLMVSIDPNIYGEFLRELYYSHSWSWGFVFFFPVFFRTFASIYMYFLRGLFNTGIYVYEYFSYLSKLLSHDIRWIPKPQILSLGCMYDITRLKLCQRATGIKFLRDLGFWSYLVAAEMYFRAVFVERKLALHVEVDNLVGALSPTGSCWISLKAGDISEDRIFFSEGKSVSPVGAIEYFFFQLFRKVWSKWWSCWTQILHWTISAVDLSVEGTI